jgi:hypothetical protein
MCIVCEIEKKRKARYEELVKLNLKMERARLTGQNTEVKQIEDSMRATFEEILDQERAIPNLTNCGDVEVIKCVIGKVIGVIIGAA